MRPTRFSIAAGCALLVGGCDAELMCKPGPWHTEVWSETPRVEAQLRDGCGFPDSQIDYRIVAHGRTVIEDSLEHFSRRHAIERRGDGSVEISIWDRGCVVTASNVVCREIDYLRWR